MFSVQVLADSINRVDDRVATIEYVAPRFILAEINTHQFLARTDEFGVAFELARNAESSRAIPVKARVQSVLDNPVIPISFGKNQRGMQAGEEVDEESRVRATLVWLEARDDAIKHARAMAEIDVHKQIANRIVEPYSWVHGIISGCWHDARSLPNFIALRYHPAAEPHFNHLAGLILEAIRTSVPDRLQDGDWHLPLIRREDWDAYHRNELTMPQLVRLSMARCARVSYNTHAGTRDPAEDFRLHDQLVANGHLSPAEHMCYSRPGHAAGKFPGFVQYRHTLPNEVRSFDLAG